MFFMYYLNLHVGVGFTHCHAVPILFEETYYNNNDESFRILCINRLLDGGGVQILPEEEEGTSVRRK